MADAENEIPPENSGEYAAEGEWLTYDQISQIRGIGRESAVKLAQREKWRRVPGNDGTARVCVPPEWLRAARRRRPRPSGEDTPDSTGEWPRAVAAFEAAITTLRERAEAAEGRAKRVEEENDRLLEDLRAERERSATERAREEEELNRTRAAAEQARQDRLAAEARADAATIRADHGDDALAGERARADGLQERIEGLLSQVAAAEAEAKAAHDRAWASGETSGAVREQMAATERRFEAERKRAERAEKRADNDREALLNAESKTWRTLAALEAADKQVKHAQSKVAEAETAAETAIRSANTIRREEEARRARGLLARLRAAWRAQ